MSKPSVDADIARHPLTVMSPRARRVRTCHSNSMPCMARVSRRYRVCPGRKPYWVRAVVAHAFARRRLCCGCLLGAAVGVGAKTGFCPRPSTSPTGTGAALEGTGRRPCEPRSGSGTCAGRQSRQFFIATGNGRTSETARNERIRNCRSPAGGRDTSHRCSYR
jgi:hypothetical protein